MNAQDTPAAFREHVEITARLRRLDDPEGIFLVWNREIEGVVAGDLQKNATVRAAFIGLPGRVQEARSEAHAGGDPLAVADEDAQMLQRIAMARVAFHIGEDRTVIAVANAREMGRETLHKRAGPPESLTVLFVAQKA